MRDYLTDDIGEILVDDAARLPEGAGIHAALHARRTPSGALKPYTDDIPLFTRFQIESQIESAYAHKVQLPSGGSMVIDYTEALVSIDINSARATRGAISRPPPPTPTWKRPRRSPASCASATSAA